MIVRELTLREIRSVYKAHLKYDFPSDERKPLAAIERSIGKGQYMCLGAFGEDGMLGYAFFVFSGRYCLLDYFAVVSGKRDMGIGSAFLTELISSPLLKRFGHVLIEIDDPAYASGPDDLAIRERRKSFYLNCGIKNTRVSALVFGVEYLLLEFPCGEDRSPEETARAYDAIYRSILPSLLYRKNILIRT